MNGLEAKGVSLYAYKSAQAYPHFFEIIFKL
jgi:hypothetical protein